MPFLARLPELPTYHKAARPVELFARARKSKVPEGGWTTENFYGKQGAALVKDILMVRRLAIRENVSALSKSLLSMFEDEASAVLGTFAAKLNTHYGAKTIGSDLVTVVLNIKVPDNAVGIWEEALRQVFEEGSVEGRVLRVFRPHYQSVLDHVTRKTTVLLAKPEKPRRVSRPLANVTATETADIERARVLTNAQLQRVISGRVQKLCSKVTRISTTTRNRMSAFFEREIKAGDSVGEVMEKFREAFPFIAASRVPTIVRNELSVAANEAQIISFQNHPTLTHCSVVGCQAIEENSPTYRGFHTCNIRNVPVGDLPYVDFHIGHTGSWVPSGFRHADGTIPRLPLGNSPGIGAYDDLNSLRHTNPAAAGLMGVVRPR